MTNLNKTKTTDIKADKSTLISTAAKSYCNACNCDKLLYPCGLCHDCYTREIYLNPPGPDRDNQPPEYDYRNCPDFKALLVAADCELASTRLTVTPMKPDTGSDLKERDDA